MRRKKNDMICGKVVRVIDGDTYEIEIKTQNRGNIFRYNKRERIRMENRLAPELDQWGGKKAKNELEKKIKGKNICIKVKARDKFGRLIGAR